MSKKGWLLTIFALLIAICAVSYVIFAMFNFNRPDTVGICYASATDGINASYRYALSQVLRQQGYAVLELDADNDQAKQLQQIKLMADRGCVALMIEPVMAAAAGELEEAIAQSGVPTVLLNRKCSSQRSTVGPDAAQAGTLLAEAVAALPNGGDINKDGMVSYVLIMGPEDHIDSQEQMEKAIQVLGNLPDMQCITQQHADLTKESGQRVCGRALTDYGPDVEVILCCNSAVTAGAVQAVEEDGWKIGSDVYVLGIGMDQETGDLVRRGAVAAVICPDLTLQATAAAEAMQALLGETPQVRSVVIPYIIVNEKNIDNFIP